VTLSLPSPIEELCLRDIPLWMMDDTDLIHMKTNSKVFQDVMQGLNGSINTWDDGLKQLEVL
jgi:hypothetical protein